VTDLVTVVVVTWDGAHLLPACLDTLMTQTISGRTRVVVVDNASTDATAEVLARYPGIDVVRTDRNLGFAGGANVGLSGARTPYAAVLNNDARPEPDWLENLLSGFSHGVGAVTSKVLLAPRFVPRHLPGTHLSDISTVSVGSRDVTADVVAHHSADGVTLAVPVPDGIDIELVVTGASGRRLLETMASARDPRVDVLNSTGGVLTASGHGADRGYLEIDNGQYDDQPDVFAVCGAAAAFRTDATRDLGWFDPWFFAYYEDLDLSWRLRAAGWDVRYVASARVRHEHAATSRVGSDVFLFHNRRNRLATLVRNATVRQIGSALLGPRRDARPGGQLLTVPTTAPAGGGTTRSRAAALRSFLGHLPVLLKERRRRPRVRAVTLEVASRTTPSPPGEGV
jgi:GT2 family glycosyltransferase